MCGILFSSKNIVDVTHVIQYLQKRGPDHTEYKKINNYHFIHVLLSMTGKDFTIQPFVYDDSNIGYVGEIYNYQSFGTFQADGECIESYRLHGKDFCKYSDGEFAIILDFHKTFYISQQMYFLPSRFAGSDIAICSYSSSLERLGFKTISQVNPNTTQVLQLSTRKLLQQHTIYDFDLKQYKTNFDDWNMAFENAIKKRTSGIKHNIFIGFSGGYDSGLISCVLHKLGIDYKAYTILGSEDIELVKKRHALLGGEIIDISQQDFSDQHRFLKENSEEYVLKIDRRTSQYEIHAFYLKNATMRV